MRRLAVRLGLLAMLAVLLAASAESGIQWLHVHVDEAGPEANRVRVNVPVSMVDALAPEIRKHVPKDDGIGIGRCEFTTAEFRDAMRTLGRARVGHVVQKRENGHRVVLKRRGTELLVEGYEERRGSRHTTARMPWSVAQALVAGNGSQLDYTGALKTLAKEPGAEIAVTDDDGTQVRIWVDEVAFAESDA